MGALGARVFFGIPLAFTLCRVDVRRVVVFEATRSRNRTDLIYYYIFKRPITVGDVCLVFFLDVVVSLLVVFSVKSLCHIFVCWCIWLRRRQDPSLQPDAGREECDVLGSHDYQHHASLFRGA